VRAYIQARSKIRLPPSAQRQAEQLAAPLALPSALKQQAQLQQDNGEDAKTSWKKRFLVSWMGNVNFADGQ
jgi:hypothetical protein